jgi:HK97 family phage portal protein
MLWLGESVWYVPSRFEDGSPAPPLWQLHPNFIDIEDGGYVTTRAPIAPELAELDGAAEPYHFADEELIVIRGLVRDGLRGIGLLQAHWWDMMLAGQLSDYEVNALRSGVPNGYLKVNAPQLTKPKARQLQDDWMRAHGGAKKRIAVLNATTEFHAIGLDPAALQLAQMRDYSTMAWALIFGVPPYMLGLTQARDTYANVESRFTELARFCLLPWAARMESGCDSELPRGQDMKINLDALLRADTATRYAAHKIGLEAHFITIDEVRDLEDRPPLTAEQKAEAEAAQQASQRISLLTGGEVPSG